MARKMKTFYIHGTNYCGQPIDIFIEAPNKTSAVKKYIKEYGGLVYRSEEEV